MNKGKETYQRVLDVAIYFFAKEGIQKTSFAMIAKELGMSKPSLYYYVESKDELIKKVFDYIFEDYTFEDYFHLKDMTKENLIEQLYLGGMDYINEIQEQDILLNLLSEFTLYANRNKEVDETFIEKIKEVQQMFIDGFVQVLQKAIEFGLMEENNIQAKAGVLALMLDNILNYKMLDMKIEEAAIWKQTITDVIK
ncbi:TetR/AcrR family transcriptional regulator [Viridibacillus sp. FSL E2-0187]|uniref:TetR/AcrR family transcriptional regulator n=1 Tax=Viridibacillus TaxID=496496 RepID=UPI00187BA1DB|nr:TetR/AcrR family transcriptional regulator [Viridibacillus sp. JNUCC-6]QOV09439.1 TetR/AcrR family transcriptional regulator [Viridibacillus sp. JNUCC-6]